MAGTYSLITSDFLNVIISTSCGGVNIEKRFQKGISISNLKGKLELVTGGSAETMTLKVFDKEDKFICALEDDNALLGSYSIDDGMRLHVEDKFILRKQCDDETGIERFEMSMEEYANRSDSLQAYLKRNKLGKYNEGEMEKKEAERKQEEELEFKKLETINIENRCQISVPGLPVRRGTVMFKGVVSFKPGYWVGVKYDEPMGKNDGSVEGLRYFECPHKYGGFVKPMYVEVGDYPEEELNFEDEL